MHSPMYYVIAKNAQNDEIFLFHIKPTVFKDFEKVVNAYSTTLAYKIN